VLAYGDGFAIVSRDLEQTLRRCYPSFVSFALAEGAEHDAATVSANDSGHRMVFSRGAAVSAPFGVFQALRDARGAAVDPSNDGRPNQPGFKVRGVAAKYPMTVRGAISPSEHAAAADAGRSMRQLQLERDAQDRLHARPSVDVTMLDGSDAEGVSVGL